MKDSLLSVGTVYWNRLPRAPAARAMPRSYRKVLELIPSTADAPPQVRYQAILPGSDRPVELLYDLAAPLPTADEFARGERVCAGAPVATCSRAHFLRWAEGPAQFDPKFKEPGRTMADLCLERVLAKGLNGIHFERALTFDSVRRDFEVTSKRLPWCFTFADGSRVGFNSPGVYAEVDLEGRPVPGGRKCLDPKQVYSEENTPALIRADFARWLPHLRPLGA